MPTKAMLTESGSAPAAKAAPRGMDASHARHGLEQHIQQADGVSFQLKDGR